MLRGSELHNLKHTLQHCSPSTVYSTKMKDLPLEKLMAGTRDGVGRTRSAIQEISSERKRKHNTTRT